MNGFGFRVTYEHVGATILVRPSGDLDVMTAPQLSRVLDAVAAHDHAVVVDLSGVGFVDCAGLAPIRRALAGGSNPTSVRLVGARPKVDRVLRLTGLGRPHGGTDD